MDRLPTLVFLGFPCGPAGKKSTYSAGDLGSIPGLGRSPGEGKGYPLQYSGPENSMDYIVHGVAKSQTRTEQLSLSVSRRWLSGKESVCWCRRHGRNRFDPGVSKTPWRRKWNGNPPQDSCLGNPMDRGGLQSIGSQSVRHNWATSTVPCLLSHRLKVSCWKRQTKKTRYYYPNPV